MEEIKTINERYLVIHINDKRKAYDKISSEVTASTRTSEGITLQLLPSPSYLVR